MKTKLSPSEIISLYQASTELQRKNLEIVFGKEAFQTAKKEDKEYIRALDTTLSINDRVQTFEDACLIKGIEVNESLSAYEKLKIIIKVINEGWIPDYTNDNQWKYFPWFEYTVGLGFSFDDVSYELTYSSVGAPFVYETDEKAKRTATQFQNLYNEMLSSID